MNTLNLFIRVVHKFQLYVMGHANNIVHTCKRGGHITWICLCSLSFVIPLIIIAGIWKHRMPHPNFYTIFIDTQGDEGHIVDERFLSLGLDSTVITTNFEDFNMTDPVLIKMIKYLSPAYLRIGGNQADQIVFSEKSNEVNHFYDELNGTSAIFDPSDVFTLKASDWLKLNKLGKDCNINIIYDLNSLLRFKNGTWNSTNAEQMLEFSHKNGLQLDWELGNEPNSYRHKFDVYVNATQLGIDFRNLRNILNKFELYKNSYLVGPSTTRLRDKEVEDFFSDFLDTGSEAVSAITWHHYYFGGQNATPEQFLNPIIFNYLYEHIVKVKSIVLEHNIKGKPIWLGETSSAWHGGAEGLTDRFIGSFLWIDKLGLSASMGIDVVVRQSIFKDYYALLNNSYFPNPDWWVSILYKKLVSNTVVVTKSEGDPKIRLYAHCAKDNWNDNKNENKSSVVVFGVNLSDKGGTVNIEEIRSDKKMFVYELTSDSLFSQFIHLNGKVLNLKPNIELPDFKPKTIKREKSLRMPPYSIVFWVLTNTNVRVCKTEL